MKRAWAAGSADNIAILAAGVSYYAFLAMVPLLAALVLGYGIFASPEAVAGHINLLAEELPQSAAGLIGEQLRAMVETSASTEGLALAIALGLALLGARNGANAVIVAVAMAFNDTGSRTFLRAALAAIALVLVAMAGAGIVAAAMSAVAMLESWLPGWPGAALLLGKAVPFAVLLAAATIGTAILYRRAPPTLTPGWKAVLPGALLAGAGIMLATLGFGFYVANFGSYNATYGSMGAVIVLLTWLYLVAYVLLIGAELAAVRARPEL